ncbi:glycosyltransferase family 2 protein [Paucilactobacillus kaifaensis]|uniref:glycosyltransferase family 2 protein n=1 Tax=Paucilactobacillus kaifaensis TaxID=2559921 RepID=UPI0010F84D44|nr:glycosyltransferase family 2 protein [Paucilactobacillus kaifaensis]
MNNTFIIVTWNNEKQIQQLIDSLTTFEPDSKIIIFDNNSSDSTVNIILKKYKHVRLISSRINVGFARANNIASRLVNTKYLTIINPDTYLETPILAKLIKGFSDSTGIMGVKLINPDGTLQPSIFNFQKPVSIIIEQFRLGKLFPNAVKDKLSPELSKHDHIRSVEWLMGAFLFMKTDFFNEIKGFSEDYFIYSEDMDICYKSYLKEKKVVFRPDIHIVHEGGMSEKQDITKNKSSKLLRSFIIFADKYGFTQNVRTLYLSYSIKRKIIFPAQLFSKRLRKVDRRYRENLQILKDKK